MSVKAIIRQAVGDDVAWRYLRSYRNRMIRRSSCPSETRNRGLNVGVGLETQARDAARGEGAGAAPRRARRPAGRAEGACGQEAGGRSGRGGEACKAGGRTGGGSSSVGAGRFLPDSEVALAAGCCVAAAVYVKRSVAGRDKNNNDVVDAQNTPKARREVILKMR